MYLDGERNQFKREAAKIIKREADIYFQPASHKDSMRNIFRTKIKNKYNISEITFYRYIRYQTKIDGYKGNGANRVYLKNNLNNGKK